MKQSRAHVTGTVFGLFFILLLLPFLVFNCTTLVRGYFSGQSAVELREYRFFLVSDTRSSEGITELEKGDLAMARQVDVNSLQPGNLIAYRSGNTTVVGSIAAVNQSSADTEPTFSVSSADGKSTAYLLPTQIVGAYVGRNQSLGKVVLFLDSTLGTLLCVGIPCLIFLLLFVLLGQKNRKQKKEADSPEKQKTEEQQGTTPPIPLISEEEKKKLEEAVASFEALQAELPPLPKPAASAPSEVKTETPQAASTVPEEAEEVAAPAEHLEAKPKTEDQVVPKTPAQKTTYVRKVQLKELQEKDDHVVIIRKGERS